MSTPVPIFAEDRIAAVAYALWLEEGQPDGRAEAHWFKALELVNAEAPPQGIAAKPARKAPAARKPVVRKTS